MRYGIYRQGEKYEIPRTPIIFMIRRDQILYSESSGSLDGNEESKHGLYAENPWDFCGIPRAPAV